MAEIGLVQVIEQLRKELARAVRDRPKDGIEFPIQSVTVTFQVGVTREGGGEGGINIGVLELGASGSYAKESVQEITLELGPPVDANGKPIAVSGRAAELPE